MPTNSAPNEKALPGLASRSWLHLRDVMPGLALSAAVSIVAVVLAGVLNGLFPAPVIVIALIIGMALHGIAARPVFQPGLAFSVKKLLRWAVALLGIRIALSDIVALGVGTVLIVIVSMIVTVLTGFLMARMLRQSAAYGALAGAATAVCGASAALATATVIPDYKGKDADTAFAVVAANTLSTFAMLGYPVIAHHLGLSESATGVLLGGTIHDVAQVVGAGYAVSVTVGNAAVVVKLFRVFLLLPVVICIGWYLSRRNAAAVEAKVPVPVPVFAIAFLALCVLNSVILSSGLAASFAPVRSALVEMSNDGLLIAIAALGLGTSLSGLARLGWRHLATVTVTTLVILVFVTAAVMATF